MLGMELKEFIEKLFEGKYRIIIKTARRSGTGAAVNVPKEYTHRKVILVLENE